jgi:hypothetical protein
MASYGGQVSNYEVSVNSSNVTTMWGTRQITCYVSVPYGGGQVVVSLFFIPGSVQMPTCVASTNQTSGDGGKVSFFNVYTPVEDYSDILDLLRNARSVGFFVDDTDINGSWNFGVTALNTGQGEITSQAIALAAAKPLPKLAFPSTFPAHTAPSLRLDTTPVDALKVR